ncbi:hypothetical protein [Microlunatus parietis]|uniref:Uncharacterized protein n=1 Tax=Microlunatus parietis TaxID=682979 RepID=A0A7Y9I302_9ACTN|nr:hypothetical protein [Microlunatus parietis]NYE69248.1 hypothetical protein [Microlunatus parietis]
MSAKDVLGREDPRIASDEDGSGRAAARGPWLMVGLALLLGTSLVVAALDWSGRTLEMRLATATVPALFVVALVWLAARTAAPELRSRITLITTFLVGGATLLLVIAPLALPQLGPRGSGLRWVAGADGAGTRPLTVVGDTAVLAGEGRLVFLRVGDGSLIADIPIERSAVATAVGDGILVRTTAGFLRYDLAGRPTWPSPVDSHRILAYDEGVVALAFCAGGDCRVEGRAATGERTWQLEVPYVALHRPDIAEYASTGLPSQLAVRTTDGPAESPHWELRSATGEPAGTLEGKAIRLIDGAAITLGGDDLGPCIVRLQNGPTEAVDCVSPWSIRVRNGLLIVEQPHGYVSVVRPGPVIGGGEPFETATALGRTPDSDLGQHGRARLTGDVLEGWPWTPFVRTGAPPAWRTAPLPVAGPTRPVVSVVGSTVVVLGDAPPGPFGTLGEESTLLAYDLADGTELARLRLPRVAPDALPGRVVPAGDRRVLVVLPGRPPLLIGTG